MENIEISQEDLMNVLQANPEFMLKVQLASVQRQLKEKVAQLDEISKESEDEEVASTE